MWKFLAVAAVSVLTSFPQARMVGNWGAEGTPSRVVLSQEAMTAIVGGLGTASIGISFPEEFAKSDLVSHAVKWNQPGNRCQFDCSSVGASNVGFNVGSYIFVLNTLSTPVLELYSDGKGRARTTANLVVSAGSYNAFTATLVTKCVGGTKNGQFCTTDSFCAGGGRCSACDHNNVCSAPPSSLAPCTPVCIGGSNNGAICSVPGDCPGGDCVSPVEGTADTCYLLSRCGQGAGEACLHDCAMNGVDDNTDSTDPFKPGPLHSAMARVTTTSGSTTFEISRQDSIYRVTKKNGAGTNCEGVPE